MKQCNQNEMSVTVRQSMLRRDMNRQQIRDGLSRIRDLANFPGGHHKVRAICDHIDTQVAQLERECKFIGEMGHD